AGKILRNHQKSSGRRCFRWAEKRRKLCTILLRSNSSKSTKTRYDLNGITALVQMVKKPLAVFNNWLTFPLSIGLLSTGRRKTVRFLDLHFSFGLKNISIAIPSSDMLFTVFTNDRPRKVNRARFGSSRKLSSSRDADFLRVNWSDERYIGARANNRNSES